MRRRDVAIVGVAMTEQGRDTGRTSEDLFTEALARGLADAGMTLDDVDGFANVSVPDGNGLGVSAGNMARLFGRPLVAALPYAGVQALLHAAALISAGLARTFVLVHGFAQQRGAGDSVVDYTTPAYEFTDWTGSFTAAQMALLTRRHMHEFGTSPEHLAAAAAMIRNAGSNNPEAVMFGRGPYSVGDILAAPMVAEPITRLMCSLVNDGGSCVVLTAADRARDCPSPPVWLLGGAIEQRYSTWYNVPTLEMLGTRDRMAAALARCGIRHSDVDLVTVYDHFPIGVLMALECLGFCAVGEGGPFVAGECGLAPGQLPVSPHGGCQAHSHNMVPYNHTIVEVVRQFRNDVPDRCPEVPSGTHTHDPAQCRKVRSPRLGVACGPLTGVFSFAALAPD